jgi:Zn-dependent protease
VLFWFPLLRGEYLLTLVWWLAFANGLLFILNLIPIPPLDGSAMLYPLLPHSLNGFVSFMYEYGPRILLGLLLLSLLLPSISPLNFVLALVQPLLNLLGLPPTPHLA